MLCFNYFYSIVMPPASRGGKESHRKSQYKDQKIIPGGHVIGQISNGNTAQYYHGKFC
jgi:hypothetical protein